MLKKKDILKKLKDKASEIKDTAVEETKKLVDEHLPNETNEKDTKAHQKKEGSNTDPNKAQTSESQDSMTAVPEKPIEESALSTTEELAQQPKSTAKVEPQSLEEILQAPLPNWYALKDKADKIISQQQSVGIVRWMENPLSIKKKHLKKGNKHDLWHGENILVPQAHPTFFEKLLAKIASLLSMFLAPWYALKNWFQKIIQNIAEKLGAAFSILALPVALLAFLGDIITMILEFIVSIPRLLLSPLTLIRSFFALILQFFAKLIARIIWAFLLPVIGKIMSGLKPGKIDTVLNLLKRMPWLRYMILGFFRSERPEDPVIIPAETVSQLLTAQRSGIFSRGEYLIIVEGEKMVSGFVKRFWSWFRMLIFPFYWERTVHIICLPRDENTKNVIVDIVASTLGMKPENW